MKTHGAVIIFPNCVTSGLWVSNKYNEQFDALQTLMVTVDYQRSERLAA